MTMPFYASPEQLMRDRSEYARKGIARGRGVVVLGCQTGVLFVAENPSNALHKVGEIYDRIGFAAVGRYPEYENLRRAGVRMADMTGYSYDRRDVSARGIANAYARTLGSIFTDQIKPFEVEICVAQVGDDPEGDELYRLVYDGSIFDEPGFVVMGGQAETIANQMRETYQDGLDLQEAVQIAVRALAAANRDGTTPRELGGAQLEVAVLDRTRLKRKFRRIEGAALTALLPTAEAPADEPADEPEPDESGAPADSKEPPVAPPDPAT